MAEDLFKKAEEASALQYADMARLAGVLNDLQQVKPLQAVVDQLPLASFAPLWRLTVTDGTKTVYFYGGHLYVWAAQALREKTVYIDLAARAVFGRFILGLGQTLWQVKLTAAGFANGQLPEDFGL